MSCKKVYGCGQDQKVKKCCGDCFKTFKDCFYKCAIVLACPTRNLENANNAKDVIIQGLTAELTRFHAELKELKKQLGESAPARMLREIKNNG